MTNRLKHYVLLSLFIVFALVPLTGLAQANLEINTPAITSIKQSMQTRHSQLVEFYNSGAVGLTKDGMIAIRDANAVPLAKRQLVNTLVSAENQDRNALYREIARANNHPEWEPKIRSTFGQRWINMARPGWWYQKNGNAWAQK
ncbi:MAG: YdbL family protein [Burkholderiales bacterium]|nr:YdbL family protein [Nitrosomonas sp.]MCP5274715.1 YdbL family protein [Burkholderiales bacterium]